MKKPIFKKPVPLSVDGYISSFPPEVKILLNELRKTIRAAAPNAEEVISYNMPAYKLKGILVYFAGYEKHIGFYPTASGVAKFRKEIEDYKWSKGAIQFPINEKLPLPLIKRVVKFRLLQDSNL